MRGLRSLLNYIACATFVAGAVFSLAACGDDSSSSASNDLPQTTEKCGEEGSYKTVKSDKVGGTDEYYRCTEGTWQPSEYRDPVESCTAENEGVVDTFTVYSGRFHTDYYFICNDGVWKETGKPAGPSVSEQCTKEDTKVGDTCVVYRPSENEGSLGLAGTSVKYVYTEAGEWEPVCQLAANGECKEE